MSDNYNGPAMAQQILRLQAEVRRQDSEIERLNNALKKQAASAIMGMDAAVKSSSQQLAQAAKIRAESSPDALESERAMNAMLTAELEQLKAERDAAVKLARDYAREAYQDVADWGAYASGYYQAKHNLEGDLKKWLERGAGDAPKEVTQ
jgi:hypothetical protein